MDIKDIRVGDLVKHLPPDIIVPGSFGEDLWNSIKDVVFEVIEVDEGGNGIDPNITIRDEKGRTFGAGPENVIKVEEG